MWNIVFRKSSSTPLLFCLVWPGLLWSVVCCIVHVFTTVHLPRLGRLLTVAQMVEQLVAAVSAFCDFWSELGAGNVIAFGWKLDTSLFATQSGALLSSIVTTDISAVFLFHFHRFIEH